MESAARDLLQPEEGGAVAILERHLKLVGAWVKRAIAVAWDSGRIGFNVAGALPFEQEVAALIDGAAGRCTDRVLAAQATVKALELEHGALRLRRGPGRSRLFALAEELGLSPLATDILLVAAAPALWGEMARLYAIVANDKDRPICDELLVCALLAGRASRRQIAAELEPRGALVRSGVLSVNGARRPFGAVTIHPVAVRRLCGEAFDGDEREPGVAPRDATVPVEELVVSEEAREGVRRVVVALADGGPARLVVRGKVGSGRRTLLAALAAATGRRLGVVDLAALAATGSFRDGLRDALTAVTLRGWFPCLTGAELLDGRQAEQVRELARLCAGPLAVRAPLDAVPPLDPGHALCDLTPLEEGERAQTWSRVLRRHALPAAPAPEVAESFDVGPGVMERVAERVARLGGDDDDVPALLDRELRQWRDDRMGSVATRVTRLATWDALVLPDEILDSVRELVGRVHCRRTVFEEWGMGRLMTTSRGLTALFEGSPGTGKSMVAGVIARELGCDLWRVDLSRVLSKWVGETERNLAQVFDAAEEGKVILLLDEADALLARRTDVESSNDRYANLEVNYLLQRLDSFSGIAILTTNLGQAIDPAVRRRLTLKLHFPFPDVDMRARLWRVHLPPELPVAEPIDCRALAEKYKLSGGYIRNIALRAAFLAAQERAPLRCEHVERAARREYLDQGKLSVGGVLE